MTASMTACPPWQLDYLDSYDNLTELTVKTQSADFKSKLVEMLSHPKIFPLQSTCSCGGVDDSLLDGLQVVVGAAGGVC